MKITQSLYSIIQAACEFGTRFLKSIDALIQKIANRIFANKPSSTPQIEPNRIKELDNPETCKKIQELVATGHYTLESAKFCAENKLVRMRSKEEKTQEEFGGLTAPQRKSKRRA